MITPQPPVNVSGKVIGGSSGDKMKCPHLNKIPLPKKVVIEIEKRPIDLFSCMIPQDIVVCLATDKKDCYKKKQRNEINRRCWELGI